MAGLVVKNAVKEFNRQNGMRTSAAALDYLSKVVEAICRDSCALAANDHIGTVKPRHVQACISALIAPRMGSDSEA